MKNLDLLRFAGVFALTSAAAFSAMAGDGRPGPDSLTAGDIRSVQAGKAAALKPGGGATGAGTLLAAAGADAAPADADRPDGNTEVAGAAEPQAKQAVEPAPVFTVPTVEIIGTTPVQGVGIDKNKVPANVQTIDQQQLLERNPLNLSDVLNSGIGSATVNNVQNNPFQPDVQIRGFTAGPLLGTPQGIAVYQNGVRVNEPFGDVVQWDTVPEFAIESVELIPGSNPVYGLNALGGALAIGMKNGFTFQGTEMEAYGGSFGRWQATGQTGQQIGDFAFYGGVTGFDESGWRDHSPSDVQQVYADGRWRGDMTEAGVNFLYSHSNLIGNGPAPIELQDMDRAAVFTFPDITKNEVFGMSADGNHAFTDTVSVQGVGYYRHLLRNTVNGDDSDFEDCTEVGNIGFLCEDPGPGEEVVEDVFGNPIPVAAIGSGLLNTSKTVTNVFGGAAQVTVDEPVDGMDNHFVAGVSIDAGFSSFDNGSETGFLNSARGVTPTGILVGGTEFNTDLNTESWYYGVYFADTLSVTQDLAVTFAGRYNIAEVSLDDQFGTELDGDHSFSRFNPALGAAYNVTDNVNIYGGYSESNRAPTPVELSCADPDEPCRVPNAFVSDPPLKQVVSRSVELGARGSLPDVDGITSLKWSAAAFGSRNYDDIIFVSAGPTVGSGFFQNAGITQRLGTEVGLRGTAGFLRWYLNYAFVNATFESHLTISSPNNPAADANGEIMVEPGDRIPGIPQHTAKIGAGTDITDDWSVSLETLLQSDQYYRGDEANLLDTVSGFAVVNLYSTYRITDWMEAFVEVNNLFDNDYETFGVLGDPTDVFPAFTGTQFVSPGAPIGAWAGLRINVM